MSEVEQVLTTQVTIVIPHLQNKQYGVHSTLHHDAGKIFYRCSAEQRALIQKWAVKLGVPIGNFSRDCAFNVAKALEKMEKEHVQASEPNRSG